MVILSVQQLTLMVATRASLLYIYTVTPYGRRAILTVMVCFFRFTLTTQPLTIRGKLN